MSGHAQNRAACANDVSTHTRLGPRLSARRPLGTARKKLTTPPTVRPSPTWAAVRPTITVKKTALPVRNIPWPVAKRIDCTESRRASGVGGRKRSSLLRVGIATILATTTSVRRVVFVVEADPVVAVRQLSAWLDDPAPDELVVETSGSTGRPKRVVLTRDAVLASATATARRL